MGRRKKYNTEEERLEAIRLTKKRYWENNKDNVKEQHKIWSDNNKDKRHQNYLKNKKVLTEEQKAELKIYMKEYRKNNKEHIKEYVEKNKLKIKQNKKNWAKKNKDKIKWASKKWKDANPEQVKINYNTSRKKRRKNDPLFRLSCNLRSMVNKAIKRMGYTKKSKTQEILGCSFQEFKIHIESKWETWMNWENYGKYNGELNYGWDIDHVKPLALTESEEDIIKINHYNNLQPLCSKVNRDIKKDLLMFEMGLDF